MLGSSASSEASLHSTMSFAVSAPQSRLLWAVRGAHSCSSNHFLRLFGGGLFPMHVVVCDRNQEDWGSEPVSWLAQDLIPVRGEQRL